MKQFLSFGTTGLENSARSLRTKQRRFWVNLRGTENNNSDSENGTAKEVAAEKSSGNGLTQSRLLVRSQREEHISSFPRTGIHQNEREEN